eukprot:GHVU01137783.1.p1 GENE.GHVU01137783.1~~GHVU01137783.1.p1  ORF type:complete len:156 (+),score=15.36 GHVU01137783.1:1168-1635(+)
MHKFSGLFDTLPTAAAEKTHRGSHHGSSFKWEAQLEGGILFNYTAMPSTISAWMKGLNEEKASDSIGGLRALRARQGIASAPFASSAAGTQPYSRQLGTHRQAIYSSSSCPISPRGSIGSTAYRPSSTGQGSASFNTNSQSINTRSNNININGIR